MTTSDCLCYACTAERDTLAVKLARICELVDRQAEDEGLWCPAVTATEAYLQQALRRLHAVVEDE